MTDENWKWYSGSDDETFTNGPFDFRDDAIEALDGYGGYVIEARKDDLRLSSHFSADDFIEAAEEAVYDMANEDGDPIFDVPSDKQADLQLRVRAAIDAWQDAHGLMFVPWLFSGQRNLEHIAPTGDA